MTMKIIINSDNKMRDRWIDLVQVESKDRKFEFTDGNSSWFQKVKAGTYLVQTQSNNTNAPVFFHHISQSLAEKLQILSTDLAVEIMDNVVCDGENSVLDSVLSLREAAELYSKDDSTLRKAIADGRFSPNEYRKTGRNYIITKEGLERVYGKPE